MNLEEFSKFLGLSKTTVSRALNGHMDVKEDTRRRVEKAAREKNYSPNLRAWSLSTGKSMVIGHVIPVSKQSQIVNPIFTDFMVGAGETYARYGYDMIVKMIDDADEEHAYRTFKAKGAVDGVVIHGPHVSDCRIKLLQELDLPFVVHGRASEVATSYNWVDVDNRQSFTKATDFLLELGHKRIGLINGPESMDFAHRRFLGFERSMKKAGIEPDTELLRHGDMTLNFGFSNALNMLGLEDPPTAILASSMTCALGVERAVHNCGLKIGRDISIITYDDEMSYLQNSHDGTTFTAVRSSVREAGQKLAEMLIGVIQNPTENHQSLLLNSDLILGNSTGAANTQR